MLNERNARIFPRFAADDPDGGFAGCGAVWPRGHDFCDALSDVGLRCGIYRGRSVDGRGCGRRGVVYGVIVYFCVVSKETSVEQGRKPLGFNEWANHEKGRGFGYPDFDWCVGFADYAVN